MLSCVFLKAMSYCDFMRGNRSTAIFAAFKFLTSFLLLVLVVSLVAVSSKLDSIRFESSRQRSPSHLLIVGLDARPGGDKGLPDTLMLLDLDTGGLEQIPRNWEFSHLDPDVNLVSMYLGIQSCEPFCGIQGVYAFSKIGQEPPISESKSLDTLARTIEREYGLSSVAIVAFDLTWAYSFFTRIAPLTLELSEAVPVGGAITADGYSGVRRTIEPGAREFFGGDLYWIARARYGTSNEDRMRRQTELVEAILRQKNLLDITSAAWGAKGFLVSDIQMLEVLRLVTFTIPTK